MVEKRDYRSREFTRFVALGESTTAGGWSTSPERCWVPRLAALIDDFQERPLEVFNAGIGANLISSRSPAYANSGKPAADERLQRHVIDEAPDLLVISYGLNDARGGTPWSLFREVMVSLVRRVRARLDPVIVLPGPYYMWDFEAGRDGGYGHASLDDFKDYNRGIAAVAEEEDCLFVDLLDAYAETDWMIHYDGVHANDLGHRIVANRIFEVLAQNCSCLARRTKEMEKTSPRWRDESTLMSMGEEDAG
jgi:lysophospholipase L1-like esterase